MKRVTSPFIRKLGEELIEVLFTNIATNIEMTDEENSGKNIQEFLLAMKNKINEIEENIFDKPWTQDIVNNLTSTDTNKALSAAQGKILKDMASEIKASSYYAEIDSSDPNFVKFMESLPDGALVSFPETAQLQDIMIKDLSTFSLYKYINEPLSKTT